MDTDSRLQKAGGRAFISFWLYFFAVMHITMVGSESKHERTHWVFMWLVVGAALTVSIYFRHVRKLQVVSVAPKSPIWSGNGLIPGIWIMACVAITSLYLSIPEGLQSWGN